MKLEELGKQTEKKTERKKCNIDECKRYKINQILKNNWIINNIQPNWYKR